MTIQRYRTNVVKPAAHAATVNASLIPNSTSINKSYESEVRVQVQQSPVRSRLESVWARTQQFVEDKALNVDNCAPVLNAATKQIDLLARLTGELQQADGPAVNIQIVIPGGPSPAGRIDLSDPESQCFEMGDKLK